jgi:hypothetical protein
MQLVCQNGRAGCIKRISAGAPLRNRDAMQPADTCGTPLLHNLQSTEEIERKF